jgi:hypothetical protein
MTNVFEGAPDTRQSADIAEKVSRFRPKYRALTEEEKALHDAIKTKAEELEALFHQVAGFDDPPHSDATKLRYRSLSLTSLEESVMWAIKALTGARYNQAG